MQSDPEMRGFGGFIVPRGGACVIYLGQHPFVAVHIIRGNGKPYLITGRVLNLGWFCLTTLLSLQLILKLLI